MRDKYKGVKTLRFYFLIIKQHTFSEGGDATFPNLRFPTLDSGLLFLDAQSEASDPECSSSSGASELHFIFKVANDLTLFLPTNKY